MRRAQRRQKSKVGVRNEKSGSLPAICAFTFTQIKTHSQYVQKLKTKYIFIFSTTTNRTKESTAVLIHFVCPLLFCCCPVLFVFNCFRSLHIQLFFPSSHKFTKRRKSTPNEKRTPRQLDRQNRSNQPKSKTTSTKNETIPKTTTETKQIHTQIKQQQTTRRNCLSLLPPARHALRFSRQNTNIETNHRGYFFLFPISMLFLLQTIKIQKQ